MISISIKLLFTSAFIMMVVGISCTKVVHRIAEDDPCTKAFVTRRNASKTNNQREKDQLLLDAGMYDQQCHDRNENAPKPSNRQ